MSTMHFRFLLLLSVLLLPAEGWSQTRSWFRQEIPADSVLHLKAFGGSDIDLSVKGRETSAIYIQWTDNTRKIQKNVLNANGYTSVILVSPTYGRTIPREHGIPVDGRISEAYLIYTDAPSGLKVYFYDTITAQNQYALLIEPSAPSPAPVATTATPTQDAKTIVRILKLLTDPVKLEKSDVAKREISPEYQKLIYWLAVSVSSGFDAQTILSDALQQNGTASDRSALEVEMVLKTFDHALAEQWLTDDNLAKMRVGECGFVPGGQYEGQKIEVAPIIPVALHPEYGNELANLRLLPAPVIAARGNLLDAEGADLISKLEALLPPVGERLGGSAVPARQMVPSGTKSSDPNAAPTWSVIGDTLFYRGKEVSEQLSKEAKAFGLNRDVYIEERAWIEKQKTYGRKQSAEYERITRDRLADRSEAERKAIEQMRSRLLPGG